MSLPIIVKDEKSGKVYVNPAKRFVKPYWHTTDPETVPLVANLGSGQIPMVVDESLGHFEIFYLQSVSTGPYLISIFDEGRKQFWQNRPVHIDTIAGVAQRPLILPETYFLNVSGGTRQLTYQFQDISGAANNVRFIAHGRRFMYKEAPQQIWKKFEDFYTTRERANLFFMTTEQNITTLVPGVANAQTFEFRVTSDAFFEALKFTYATFPPNIPLDIRLWEYGSGRPFLPANQRINVDNMFGSAQFPGIPCESYLFERDWRISGDVVNNGPVNCDVYLTIIGRRVKFPEEVLR